MLRVEGQGTCWLGGGPRGMRIVKVLPPRRGTSFPARRNVIETIVPTLCERETTGYEPLIDRRLRAL